MNKIEDKIQEYFKWLQDNTLISSDPESEWNIVSIPYTAFFNDCIDIYVREMGSYYLLSDGGETFSNLDMLGLTYNKGVKRDHIDYVCRIHGVQIDENKHLNIQCEKKDFAISKHNLLTAILELAEMQYLVKDNIVNLFKDEVFDVLMDKQIRHTPEFRVSGQSGLEYVFDVQLAGLKEELLVKTFNRLQQDNVERFLFSWQDVHNARTAEVRGKKVCGLAVINDLEISPKAELLEALKNMGTRTLRWSERTDKLDKAFDVA